MSVIAGVGLFLVVVFIILCIIGIVTKRDNQDAEDEQEDFGEEYNRDTFEHIIKGEANVRTE